MAKQKTEKVMIAVLLVLAVFLAICTGKVIKQCVEERQLSHTKVVLYEGPKSLKDATKEDSKSASETSRDFSLMHCTDTKITVNGQECYVYDTNVNHSRSWSQNYTPAIARTPVTYFDFEGKVSIQIQMEDMAIDSVTVSPLSYDISPVIDEKNHTVTFTIDTPDAYTVMLNDSPERAVHIFANPLETEKPDLEDENVIYFGPGEWDIDSVSIESGQTIYLAGGAVVHGSINGNFVHDVTVCGRGILDGSYYEGWKGTTAYIPLKFDYCHDITLKDILVLNANAWVCQAFESQNGVIDGLKIISPRPNGDGISIQSCQDYDIGNCFVRTWDDSLVVKNYGSNSENISFHDIQLWTDLAQSMEVGYETNKGCKENAVISNITFENITVLHNYHKPVISIHNADDAKVENIVFRDIVIEDAQMGSGDGAEMPYLIDIHITQNGNWSSTKERGTIQAVTIENVTVLGGKFCASRIKGFDEAHQISNVSICNLNILGEKITSFEKGNFEIDEKTTEGLSIQ